MALKNRVFPSCEVCHFKTHIICFTRSRLSVFPWHILQIACRVSMDRRTYHFHQQAVKCLKKTKKMKNKQKQEKKDKGANQHNKILL